MSGTLRTLQNKQVRLDLILIEVRGLEARIEEAVKNNDLEMLDWLRCRGDDLNMEAQKIGQEALEIFADLIRDQPKPSVKKPWWKRLGL